MDPKHVHFTEFSAAAMYADRIAFQPTSVELQTVLYFLRKEYRNVTCNIVKEIFYQRNIIWQFKYFGSEGLYRCLQWISADGLFLVYSDRYKFVDEFSVRNHPVVTQDGIGALENLLIAFQLYLLLGGIAVLRFLGELVYPKVSVNYKIDIVLLKLRSLIKYFYLKFSNFSLKRNFYRNLHIIVTSLNKQVLDLDCLLLICSEIYGTGL